MTWMIDQSEIIKISQIKILEMKNSITQVNTMECLTNRQDWAEF